jgi:tocopherol O-methyltransferase
VIIPPACVDVAAVAAHYDDLDDLYRSLWGTNLHHGYWITGKETTEEAVNNLTRLVAERASIKPGDRICDLGCGYGAAALALNRRYGASVIGLTISEKQVHHAKAAAIAVDSVEFYLRDALDSDLPAASFDAVIAIESSEHMANKPRFFLETHRLLRPGGRCVITAWLVCSRPGPWTVRHLIEPICLEGRLPSMASTAEYRSMLENVGFHDVEFIDLTVGVKKTWRICAFRILKRIFTDRSLRRVLSNRDFTNRLFAKTVFRIWLAYQTGSMRYGCFSARK